MNEQLSNVFRGMTLSGKAAVTLAVLALVVTVWSSAGVLGALIRPALDTSAVPDPGEGLAARFASALDDDRSFIDSKSIFFTPKAPVKEDPPKDVGPVEARSRYAGPKLMGLSGHFAYFDRAVRNGAQEIKIGEKGGTVELLRVLPPFKAIVKWQTQEWTLDLLETEAIYAAVPLGAGGAGGFGTAGRASANPFTSRGGSPNSNALFQDASTQSRATGGGVPPRRPPRGGPTEN